MRSPDPAIRSLPSRPVLAGAFLLLVLACRLPAVTVVCLGDSLTAGYGLAEDQAWPAILAADLAADHPGLVVINAGRSGDTSAGGRRRLDWSLKGRPDAVVIALGANDGLRGLSLADLEANLAWIVARTRAAGAVPVVAGMQLPTNLGEDYRRDFAGIFPRVAEGGRAPLIPFLLAGVAMHPELNQGDGIHPNAEGQRIVAANVKEVLLPVLAALGAKPGPGPASAPAAVPGPAR